MYVWKPLKPWSLPKLPSFYWPTEAVEGYRMEGGFCGFCAVPSFPFPDDISTLRALHSFFLVPLVENPLIFSSSFSSVAKYSTWFKGSPTSP